MSWKMRLESVSESVNDHLRLRNDYLVAENRILRHQIDGRVQLTDRERKALAELSAELGKQALEAIATVARPDTILAWNRTFADQQVDTSKPPQSVGRPRLGKAIEDLVVCMARENRTWGYDRIQGALTHLGYTISDRAVGHILKRHGISPAPERHRTVTWREFIRSHLDMWLATDFFNREIWSWCGLLVSCLLSFLHWGRHHIRSVSYQTRQDRRSFVRQALEWSAHRCRRGGFVKRWPDPKRSNVAKVCGGIWRLHVSSVRSADPDPQTWVRWSSCLLSIPNRYAMDPLDGILVFVDSSGTTIAKPHECLMARIPFVRLSKAIKDAARG
jgi:transposase